MADVGKPPVHYVGKDNVYEVAKKRWIGANLAGPIAEPSYEWVEVLYSWVGHNGKWYLQYDSQTYEGVTLENARYWEGPQWRGDMACFGNGLQELPDPLPTYTGSQYKFYTSPTDTLENYVNFATVSFNTNGTADVEKDDPEFQTPFGIEGVRQLCKFRGVQGQFFRTVTAPGQQGFNWGVGAFFGTLTTLLFPNTSVISFRIPVGSIAGFAYQWLWYAGSDNATGVRSGEFAGLLVVGNGEIRYVRNSSTNGVMRLAVGNAVRFGEWMTVRVSHDSLHTNFELAIDVNTIHETIATKSQLNVLTGDQFQDVYVGAGPELNLTTNTVDSFTGNTHRGDLDLFRMYIDTNPTISDVLAPEWWRHPHFKLLANVDDPDGVEVDITDYAINLPTNQDNRTFTMQMPDTIGTGQFWLRYEGNQGVSNKIPMAITNPIERTTELFCDFDDPEEWERDFLIAHKQWGGTGQTGLGVVLLNGGVSSENIEVYPNYVNTPDNVTGVLRTYANGNFYDGPIIGVDRIGNPSPTNRKTEVGGCIATRDYLGPGQFRMRVRPMLNDGCCNCCWTFHYEEINENDSRWEEFKAYGDEGLHPQGNDDSGKYIVRNNEIDIEWPTAAENAVDMEVVEQDRARLNSWQGELRSPLPEADPEYFSEYSDEFEKVTQGMLNDGQWHTVGFDWHVNDLNPPINPATGLPRAAKRVDFYVDDFMVLSLETHVPDIPGRFWMGTWFPRAPDNRWSGANANYARDSMDIDWFRWTPFTETGVRPAGETYPNDIWRDWNNGSYDFHVTDTLPAMSTQQAPVLDGLPKDANGDFQANVLRLVGTNPASYIGQNRLEWRTDRTDPGLAGDAFFTANQGVQVRIDFHLVEIAIEGSGIEIVTFEAGNDVVPITGFQGDVFSHTFTTRNNTNTFLIRRGAGARDYVGRTDIILTYL